MRLSVYSGICLPASSRGPPAVRGAGRIPLFSFFSHISVAGLLSTQWRFLCGFYPGLPSGRSYSHAHILHDAAISFFLVKSSIHASFFPQREGRGGVAFPATSEILRRKMPHLSSASHLLSPSPLRAWLPLPYGGGGPHRDRRSRMRRDRSKPTAQFPAILVRYDETVRRARRKS